MRVVCAIGILGLATIAGAATVAGAATTATASPTAFATLELPHLSLVPGGIFVTPIDAPPTQAPVVTYDGKRAMVLRSDDRWVAVVGLPLAITPGKASIQVQSADAPAVPIQFDVVD